MECNSFHADQITATHNNMGEIYMLYVNERNHIRKATYILYDSIMWHSRENRSVATRRWEYAGEAGHKGKLPWGKFGGGMEMFYILIMIVVT